MADDVDQIMHWHQYQQRWLADDARFKVGCWSRQTGKTLTSCAEIVRDCVQAEAAGRRARWVILSRGERQAKEAINEAVKPLLQAFSTLYQGLQWTESGLDYTGASGIRYQGAQITLPGGSRITALPASADTARGFSANVLLDEFAFHQDSRAIWTALVPVVSAGHKLRVVSTPNGRGNQFYELMSSATGWSRHTVSIHQAVAEGLVRDTKALKNALNDSLMWRQEFECEFIDEATAWLPYELIDGCEHIDAGLPTNYQDGPVYMGCDIATRRDLFTLCALELSSDVLWCRDLYARSAITFAEQYALRARWMKRYRVEKLAIDQTGMGEETVEREGRQYGSRLVEGVLFSAPRKLALASALKECMEDRRLRLPIDAALRADLHSIRRTSGPTGAPRLDFDGSDTDGHGDRFWALALACAAAATGGAGLATGWLSAKLDVPAGYDQDDQAPARWHQGAW